MRIIVAIIGFFMIFPLVAMADSSQRTITVSGQGRVDAVPDMANITLGVTQQARSAGEALSAVAQISADIYARLEAAGIEARDMQTSGLNLHPFHRQGTRPANEPPRIAGFSASNMITVRVRDLTILGGILDDIAADGANEFRGLQFGLQVPEPLQNEARILAVKDAMARAALMAEAAGVPLGELLTLSSGSHSSGRTYIAMEGASFARSADVMPVAAGEMSLTATVTMVFAIGE